MQYHLFDTSVRYQLFPFTHTRAVAHIRCGILTPYERWQEILSTPQISLLTEKPLQALYPITYQEDNVYINSAVLQVSDKLLSAIKHLQNNTALYINDQILAFRTHEKLNWEAIESYHPTLTPIAYSDSVKCLDKVWDIFSLNELMITEDYTLLTKNRSSQPIPEYVTVSGLENVFVEEGAILNPCIINATKGPVYIGKDAEVMEGCLIRGPLAVCAHSVLKMGSKIYGGTTIGPGSKVGGEISNVVFFANSNKGHDGFLGNAVIGEWCNLGADTNCSNLKNNYEPVKIWNEHENKSVKTGLQFCGLLMGDHSKCGINTMFNTGTIVGVSCNIYGGNFPPNFIPSFSWGGADSMTPYRTEKALETARNMMARRNQTLSDAEIQLLNHIFEQTKPQRAMLHIQ